MAALNEHFAEAETKEALRTLILQRFAGWLDHVLAEEKPLTGLAEDLLAELYDDQQPDAAGTMSGADDLYSTWSAMTALTQEIKLQGRAFKQLNKKMASFADLTLAIDKLSAAYRQALSEARRIAEAVRTDRSERETEMKLAARNHARYELIGVITEIRDSLIIGLRSAAEGQRKLKESPKGSRLKNFFTHNADDRNHKLEVVNSLNRGYQMSLDRIDEALQSLGVTEIVCEGKPFDPRLMKAVDIEETAKVPDGTVLEIYRTGYMIDAEVLQPAQVKVARTPKQTTYPTHS